MSLFDDRLCTLGEGPLWHPLRKQLFWFDIEGKALLTRKGESVGKWVFDDYVSAAGWVDEDRLLIASATELFVFNLETGTREHVCSLETDKSANRSNDGRADAYGGFWIGTMGFDAELAAGSIYRYYRGELRLLYSGLTVTNSICFAPGGVLAYFTDTRTFQVMKVGLNEEGWPVGEPELFLDLSDTETKPDGAVVDRDGNVWIAHWGSCKVSAYRPDGSLLVSEPFPVTRTSCPAFGGDDYSTLFVTSARTGASEDELARDPLAGAVFARKVNYVGQKENQVIL